MQIMLNILSNLITDKFVNLGNVILFEHYLLKEKKKNMRCMFKENEIQKYAIQKYEIKELLFRNYFSKLNVLIMLF